MRGWGRGQISPWAATPHLCHIDKLWCCVGTGVMLPIIFFIRDEEYHGIFIWLLQNPGAAEMGSSSPKCGDMPPPCWADAWIWSCATCSKWTFFSRTVGLDGLQRSLWTWTILWLILKWASRWADYVCDRYTGVCLGHSLHCAAWWLKM